MQVSISYDCVFTVDPRGRSAGLAIFYMYDPKKIISYYGDRMIDVETIFEGH